MSIDLIGISKRFGAFTALESIDLRIGSGELIALLGPSGSGKTTLLRIIAGLEWPDSGDVKLDGESTVQHSVRERQIGFVFQHYALFRHMTVFENVAFGLRVRPRRERPAEAEIGERVQRLLDLVQLGNLAQRYPSQLSGGQRQRVALARALAIDPKVLLLDEPFGALDAKVRKDLRRWLRRLHDQLGTTTVFVTHDQEEALELADRVVVMGQGRIEQVGSPASVYGQPSNPFVYKFLGNVNEIPGRIENGRVVSPAIEVDALENEDGIQGEAALFVRPHDVRLTPDARGPATVRFIGIAGPFVRVEALFDDQLLLLEAEIPREDFAELSLAIGERVRPHFRRARLFARQPGQFDLNAEQASLLSSNL
jgi:sulfate transport system ATP-binding protein